MDPITLALIAAITAGVVGGIGKVGENALLDAYQALKGGIKKKFGMDSEIAKAVEGLEAKPDSTGRKETLREEVVAANADQDPDLLSLAQALLDSVKNQPQGASIIQQISGDYNVQATNNSTVNYNVNQPKD